MEKTKANTEMQIITSETDLVNFKWIEVPASAQWELGSANYTYVFSVEFGTKVNYLQIQKVTAAKITKSNNNTKNKIEQVEWQHKGCIKMPKSFDPVICLDIIKNIVRAVYEQYTSDEKKPSGIELSGLGVNDVLLTIQKDFSKKYGIQSIQDLPDEVKKMIFGTLPKNDRLRLRATSALFKNLIPLTPNDDILPYIKLCNLYDLLYYNKNYNEPVWHIDLYIEEDSHIFLKLNGSFLEYKQRFRESFRIMIDKNANNPEPFSSRICNHQTTRYQDQLQHFINIFLGYLKYWRDMFDIPFVNQKYSKIIVSSPEAAEEYKLVNNDGFYFRRITIFRSSDYCYLQPRNQA